MIAGVPVYVVWVGWSVLLVICTVLSSMYSGMETGAYAINRIRLELRCESGSRAGRFLRKMLHNSNNLLSVLLIGTNLSRYVATFCVTTMFVMGGYERSAGWCTLAIATPVMFVLGDAVPKSIFRRAPETLMYRTVWLLRWSNRIFNVAGLGLVVRGISALFMRLTGAHRLHRNPLEHLGIASIVAEGRASGLLTQYQSRMADRVMTISRVTLRNVMKPMDQVVTVAKDTTREELLGIIRSHDYSRLPILDESKQVIAVLDILDVLGETDEPGATATPSHPLSLSDKMNVTEGLYNLQRSKGAMGIVTDEDGKHVGIVTVKDLVEEIVGELEAW